MNTLIDEFLAAETKTAAKSSPAVDITESDKAFVVLMELPGTKKEDVKLMFEEGVLTVTGERKPYEIPERAKVVMNEMRIRAFERSFRFGPDVEAEGVSAEMSNGLLRITLPKKAQMQPRTISVK